MTSPETTIPYTIRRRGPFHPVRFLVLDGSEVVIFSISGKRSGDVLIDFDDLPMVATRKWRIDVDGYVIGGPTSVKLHRFIMNCPSGLQVDHVYQNKLDCRKKRLRICSQTQQAPNRGITSINSSGYKGVSRHTSRNKWTAFLMRNWLGYFDLPEDAAKAYDKAAIVAYGEFAWLNFPEEHGLPSRT